MKYGGYLKDRINHFKFFGGDDLFYHQGMLLQVISEFSVGFSTSAATEADVMGTRFVSFWNRDAEDFEDLCEDVANHSGEYRLAQSKNIFPIYPGYKLPEEEESLLRFMEDSKATDCQNKFEIDPFLESIFN